MFSDHQTISNSAKPNQIKVNTDDETTPNSSSSHHQISGINEFNYGNNTKVARGNIEIQVSKELGLSKVGLYLLKSFLVGKPQKNRYFLVWPLRKKISFFK